MVSKILVIAYLFTKVFSCHYTVITIIHQQDFCPQIFKYFVNHENILPQKLPHLRQLVKDFFVSIYISTKSYITVDTIDHRQLCVIEVVCISYRYFFISYGIQKALNFSESDVIYTALPLYHTNANILGMGQMITLGCTIALRKKFSASNFWNDCIKYQCTVSCSVVLVVLILKLQNTFI